MKNLLSYTNRHICELLNIECNKAEDIKKVISGYLLPENFKTVKTWINQCYNKPSVNELKLCAINEIMSGYGVEGIEVSSDFFQHFYYGNCIASYINLGDTYTTTVLFDHRTEKFYIISWGDFYEGLNIKE
jgi:hypothetical protein